MKNKLLWPLSNPDKIINHLQLISGQKLRAIKYPWEILDLLELALKNLKNSVHPGNVFIAPNVKIFDSAKIVGPAYIGEGTIIGNGALVRDSVIAEKCVVGYCTEIARSYIGPQCWFHTNYVGDSVFEENISMGSGAITANLRLDETQIKTKVGDDLIGSKRNKFGAIVGRGVRFGINAGIMPGVKIGKDSFIASAAMLNQDLPDKSFAVLRQEIEIKKNRTSVSMKTRQSFHNKL